MSYHPPSDASCVFRMLFSFASPIAAWIRGRRRKRRSRRVQQLERKLSSAHAPLVHLCWIRDSDRSRSQTQTMMKVPLLVWQTHGMKRRTDAVQFTTSCIANSAVSRPHRTYPSSMSILRGDSKVHSRTRISSVEGAAVAHTSKSCYLALTVPVSLAGRSKEAAEVCLARREEPGQMLASATTVQEQTDLLSGSWTIQGLQS